MNKIIDTHAHLFKSFYKETYDDAYIKTINELFLILSIGFNDETIKESLKLSDENEKFYSAIGYHPLDINEFNNDSEKRLNELLKNDKVIAIGEIGLDYHYKPYDKEKQKEVFIRQIKMAIENKLPIIIHARDSLDDLYEIIKNFPQEKFLLHSWANEWDITEKFLKLGNIWFGFNGIITFGNSKYLTETLEKIPKDKILFETDSPFLSPVPKRGKKNYPYNVKYIYEYFSNINNMNMNELEDIIFKNFKTFFNIEL